MGAAGTAPAASIAAPANTVTAINAGGDFGVTGETTSDGWVRVATLYLDLRRPHSRSPALSGGVRGSLPVPPSGQPSRAVAF